MTNQPTRVPITELIQQMLHVPEAEAAELTAMAVGFATALDGLLRWMGQIAGSPGRVLVISYIAAEILRARLHDALLAETGHVEPIRKEASDAGCDTNPPENPGG